MVRPALALKVARVGATGVMVLYHVAAQRTLASMMLYHVATPRALALKVAIIGAVGVVVLCCGFGYLVAGIVAGMIAGMVAEMGIAGECPHVVYPFAAESVI